MRREHTLKKIIQIIEMAKKTKYVLLRDGKKFHSFDTLKEARQSLETMTGGYQKGNFWSKFPSGSKYKIKKV